METRTASRSVRESAWRIIVVLAEA
jgi:hypothetical protein